MARNLGDLNTWTKNDLARVIVQALHSSTKPFPADHFKVVDMAKRKKPHLVEQAERAINILHQHCSN